MQIQSVGGGAGDRDGDEDGDGDGDGDGTRMGTRTARDVLSLHFHDLNVPRARKQSTSKALCWSWFARERIPCTVDNQLKLGAREECDCLINSIRTIDQTVGFLLCSRFGLVVCCIWGKWVPAQKVFCAGDGNVLTFMQRSCH